MGPEFTLSIVSSYHTLSSFHSGCISEAKTSRASKLYFKIYIWCLIIIFLAGNTPNSFRRYACQALHFNNLVCDVTYIQTISITNLRKNVFKYITKGFVKFLSLSRNVLSLGYSSVCDPSWRKEGNWLQNNFPRTFPELSPRHRQSSPPVCYRAAAPAASQPARWTWLIHVYWSKAPLHVRHLGRCRHKFIMPPGEVSRLLLLRFPFWSNITENKSFDKISKEEYVTLPTALDIVHNRDYLIHSLIASR